MAEKQKKEFAFVENLNGDHRFVLDGLKNLDDAVKRSDFRKALKVLEEMEKEMDLHFQKEETILFPVLTPHFEQALRQIGENVQPKGPTHVMFLEHRAILTLVRNLKNALNSDNKDEVAQILRQFTAFLKSHIFREETVLYVVADAQLKGDERAKVAEGIRRLSGKK